MRPEPQGPKPRYSSPPGLGQGQLSPRPQSWLVRAKTACWAILGCWSTPGCLPDLQQAPVPRRGSCVGAREEVCGRNMPKIWD